MLEFNFSPFPVIKTERLTLREIRRDDADEILAFRTYGDYVEKHPDLFLPKSIEEIQLFVDKIIEGVAANEAIAWAIALNGRYDFIGLVNFHRTDRGHHRAEISFQMDHAFWTQTYMTEAVKAVIDYGFNTMKLHSIEAQVHKRNNSSISVLNSCGFEQEGYFKEKGYLNGKFFDTPVFSLINKQA